MKPKIVTLKQSEDLVLDLPAGVFKAGQKVSVTPHEGGFMISPLEEVEIELDDDVFAKLALMAHERDITFNELVNEVLIEQLDRLEKSEAK